MSWCERAQEDLGKLPKLHPEKLHVHFCTEVKCGFTKWCFSLHLAAVCLPVLVSSAVRFDFSLQTVFGMQEAALLALPGWWLVRWCHLFSIEMLIWKYGEIGCESLVRLLSVLKQGEMATTMLYCSSYLFLESLGFLFFNVQAHGSMDFIAACCVLLGPAQRARLICVMMPFVKIFTSRACPQLWIVLNFVQCV